MQSYNEHILCLLILFVGWWI